MIHHILYIHLNIALYVGYISHQARLGIWMDLLISYSNSVASRNLGSMLQVLVMNRQIHLANNTQTLYRNKYLALLKQTTIFILLIEHCTF